MQEIERIGKFSGHTISNIVKFSESYISTRWPEGGDLLVNLTYNTSCIVCR